MAKEYLEAQVPGSPGQRRDCHDLTFFASPLTRNTRKLFTRGLPQAHLKPRMGVGVGRS
jgi:hypothetical protein